VINRTVFQRQEIHVNITRRPGEIYANEVTLDQRGRRHRVRHFGSAKIAMDKSNSRGFIGTSMYGILLFVSYVKPPAEQTANNNEVVEGIVEVARV